MMRAQAHGRSARVSIPARMLGAPACRHRQGGSHHDDHDDAHCASLRGTYIAGAGPDQRYDPANQGPAEQHIQYRDREALPMVPPQPR
jgi:hypothetical protein